ncbi:Ferrous-iron efflux pump FieF [anaerobic digester metagenome]
MTDFLIKRFIKSDNVQDPAVREKYGYLGSAVGILVNIALFGLKLTVGLLMNSISVIADAFNNLSDTASSLITMIGFRLGNRPADEGHPYGHGRIEYFSGLIVSVLVLYVGIQFLVTSVRRILNPTPLEFRWIPIILLIVSIFSKIWISGFNHTIGNKINSSALKASALDAKGDVMISSTVVAGLLFSHFSHIEIDGYIGLFVAGMIVKSAWELIRETLNPLLGTQADEELIERMNQILLSNEEVFGVHDTVTHNYGPSTVFATTHVEVRDDISVTEIHDIIDDLEKRVLRELDVELVIHMDPIRMADEKKVAIVRHLRDELLQVDGVRSLHDVRLREHETRYIAELVVDPETDLASTQQVAEQIVRDHQLEPDLHLEVHNLMSHGWSKS